MRDVGTAGGSDFQARGLLIGEAAARLVRLSWSVWAIVLAPISVVFFASLALPGTDAAPFSFFVAVAGVAAVLVLPFVSIGMRRRASFEAGTYLDSARYIGRDRLPAGVVGMRPRMIESWLLVNGIPHHGEVETVRTTIPTAGASGWEFVPEIVRALRSRMSAADWRLYLAGFIALIVGTLIAIGILIVVVISVASGTAGSLTPVRSILFAVPGGLIFGGAALTYRSIRRMRR